MQIFCLLQTAMVEIGLTTHSWTTKKCLRSEAMDQTATIRVVTGAIQMGRGAHMGVLSCIERSVLVHSICVWGRVIGERSDGDVVQILLCSA